MNLKSYYAASVESAMATASKELGSDAMLVLSRETPLAQRNWGRYEVVFGWNSNDVPTAVQNSQHAPKSKAPARAVKTDQPSPLDPTLQDGVNGRSKPDETSSDTARQAQSFPIRSLRAAVRSRSGELESRGDRRTEKARVAAAAPAGHGARVIELLKQRGFSDALATEVAKVYGSGQGVGQGAPGPWHALETLIPLAEEAAIPKAAVWAIAGPPGAGKSSVVSRLALMFSAVEGARVHLVSTDGGRLCGGHLLNRAADLMGAAYSSVSDLASLDGILRSEPPGGIVLAEIADRLVGETPVWGGLRRRHAGMQVQLVLPATFSPHALDGILERYLSLQADRLIATHLDTAAHAGAICSLAMSRKIPLSYLTNRNSMVEGLEKARVEALISGVISKIRLSSSIAESHAAVSGGGA